MSIYKRRITIENRGKIVALDQEGYSRRKIAEIAEQIAELSVAKKACHLSSRRKKRMVA